jgi:hypothetical protein
MGKETDMEREAGKVLGMGRWGSEGSKGRVAGRRAVGMKDRRSK